MKLTELEPRFLKFERTGSSTRYNYVNHLNEADGISFLCPKCFAANGFKRPGVHSVLCWFEGKVPGDVLPGPGRWNPTGTGYADLSFVPGKRSHSVLLTGGCAWHGFINNGEVSIL